LVAGSFVVAAIDVTIRHFRSIGLDNTMPFDRVPSEHTTRAAALSELGLLGGCYPPESNTEGTFVWAPGRFRLRPSQEAKFMRLEFVYLAAPGNMKVHQDGILVEELPLRKGWQECFLQLPANRGWLDITVDPVASVANDTRELGMMLRTVTLFNDRQRYTQARATAANALLNDEEFRTGTLQLRSYPQYLRINSETRCNIPETSRACTYCAWDAIKQMEKGSPEFRLETLDLLGEFYRGAVALGDCSVGEPTMNKEFAEILLRFHRDGKPFTFATNGQLLVEKRRRELLGRNVTVYVSLDAATTEGFKRYRNDRFESIIKNLRALCAEKREHENLPTVFASIIVMRSNVKDLPEYFDLMKDIGVDQVKCRTLYLDDKVTPVVKNNEYLFDYASEILSMSELLQLTQVVRELADARGVTVYLEWDEFEPAEIHGTGEPLCAEPWKTLYVLNRGVMPCCYATKPLAKWEEQGDRPLQEFLRDTFNSEEYQHIRAELAAGQLAKYCKDTPSCPVLKRMLHAGSDPNLTERY
jgi:MoaA/NifB/PqqE/SkfB family radical SAM enzyme